jgi:hypothetical protein
MIQKKACHSKTLSELSDAAERLWWRLLTSTDDRGLFEADPCIVLGQCVPRLKWSEERISELISELERVGLVKLYSVDGVDYGQVLTFSQYNRVRGEARFPLPPTTEAVCGELPQDAASCGDHSGRPSVDSYKAIRLSGYQAQANAEDPRAIPGTQQSLPVPAAPLTTRQIADVTSLLDHYVAELEAVRGVKTIRPKGKARETARDLLRLDNARELVSAFVRLDEPALRERGWPFTWIEQRVTMLQRAATGAGETFEGVRRG